MDLIRESSFAQYLTRQGEEKGIERGLQRGILAVLEIRFDLSTSHPLATRIGRIGDLDSLERLHREALQAPSLDAFGQLLDEESD